MSHMSQYPAVVISHGKKTCNGKDFNTIPCTRSHLLQHLLEQSYLLH